MDSGNLKAQGNSDDTMKEVTSPGQARGHRMNRRMIQWIAVGTLVLGLCVAGSLLLRTGTKIPRTGKHQNRLAIGRQAATPAAVPIYIAAPAEFDFKSKTEILDWRKEAVSRHPELIQGKYEPSDAVFGRIADRTSWWGIEGEFFHGSGAKSIEGVSEESRFVLNPFLLVAAEFLGLSIWQHENLEWDRNRISKENLNDPEFPFYCKPLALVWNPQQARAEVTYDVSAHISRLNQYAVKPLGIEHATFDLIAYNARDLGLEYLHLSPGDSRNILQTNSPEHVFRITHFLHCGGSSGYPGGSNNMSPFTPDVSGIQIVQLPAEAHVRLWHEKPEDVTDAPDMTFIIRFK